MDSVSPMELMNAINASKSDEDGFAGGGMWLWLIIIFLFFGGFGNGFGGFGGGNAAVNTLSNEFLYTNLNSGQVGIANGISSLGYEVAQQFGNTNMAIAVQSEQIGAQIANCCCTTQRNIDSVRYDNAINTRDILQSNCENTQKILDAMKSQEIQNLRDNLLAAQLTLQNTAQTQTLIATLQPVPVPAYTVSSPYCPASNTTTV